MLCKGWGGGGGEGGAEERPLMQALGPVPPIKLNIDRCISAQLLYSCMNLNTANTAPGIICTSE